MGASTFWYELRVKFYIEDGTGDYEWDDTIVIPREELRVGMSLFDGLDRKAGWTRWGDELVKAIEPDGVMTTAGLVTTERSVVVGKRNVMPYRDGYYSISLN